MGFGELGGFAIGYGHDAGISLLQKQLKKPNNRDTGLLKCRNRCTIGLSGGRPMLLYQDIFFSVTCQMMDALLIKGLLMAAAHYPSHGEAVAIEISLVNESQQ